MVTAINNTHEKIAPHLIDLLSPSCVYITRAALKHIHDNAGWKNKSWLWETDRQTECFVGSVQSPMGL
ncbi:hypothetical protein BDV41DRAFT_552612 [Aspergillus transmontanensis]|uniref:Uncharacterized protein n=1 Tax=Aspergillus transmontanensis TaxID=1034304 RepID=A0A5N6VLK5_9EURO|nr:hypothetical protein BDV41DRAFT_552612 [Aspergillus transmontanensis]